MTSSSVVPITVDSQAPIQINAQITEQIKLLIARGKLKPGDTLPTVIQLAEYLQVNHNTVAVVYNHLIELGYLIGHRGRGTFVANTEVVQKLLSHQYFYNLLGQAYTTAAQFGLDPSEFGAAAYAQAVTLSQRQSTPLVLVFVECLHHYADLYFDIIQTKIGSPLLFLNLEDLKLGQSIALKKLLTADLVLTTAQHMWEVTQIAAPEQEIMKVAVKPELQLFTQISSLPRGARVLIACCRKTGSEILKQMLEEAGISRLSLQPVDFEYIQRNHQLLDQVDVVYASPLVYHDVRKVIPQPEKVVMFNFSIDPTNISVLKARLAAIQLGKQTALLNW
jgi:DNA-binding transcriptional regulator YhcF (GntR family)